MTAELSLQLCSRPFLRGEQDMSACAAMTAHHGGFIRRIIRATASGSRSCLSGDLSPPGQGVAGSCEGSRDQEFEFAAAALL